MGLIQNALAKWKAKRERSKEYDEELLIKDKVEARRMNSDERELNRFHEEDRQKQIKTALNGYRKKMNHDTWAGKKGNPVYADNIIKDQKNLFSGKNIFSGGNTIFNQPDLFGGKNNLFFS